MNTPNPSGPRRAPANGAPGRYAADPDLDVSRPVSGGSTPLATALTSKNLLPQKPKSVTYVLNQECYPSLDRAPPLILNSEF